MKTKKARVSFLIKLYFIIFFTHASSILYILYRIYKYKDLLIYMYVKKSSLSRELFLIRRSSDKAS